MTVEIRRLTPDLAEDYVHFFDVTPHDDNVDDHKCYCITWRSEDSLGEYKNHWASSREKRRNLAIQYIKNGTLQGYLAYIGDRIVGWCNANTNCKSCINYLRSYFPIDECRNDIKIKSVFCFMIAPDVQRTGVATQLLERVCQDAADDGFDFVEAYVCKTIGMLEYDFRGHLPMYEKCGFYIHAERDDKIVVRKSLKS